MSELGANGSLKLMMLQLPDKPFIDQGIDASHPAEFVPAVQAALAKMQAHIAAAEQLIGGGDSESLASRQTGDAGDEDLVSRQFYIQKNTGAFRSLHASGAIQCTCRTPERMHLQTA